MKRIGIFLVVAALMAGMAGCAAIGAGYGQSCLLTITSSSGGSVITPGEGTFACGDGEVVNLWAQPQAGYLFVNWTGNVGTIANPSAASTTITANGSYSIRANFLEDPSRPLGINYTETDVEELIIVLVNSERQDNGLCNLTQDALLTSLAREHSINMAENHNLTHNRSVGERPLSYNMSPGTMRGENLAKIPTRQTIPGPYLSLQEVCEWAVSGWMNSTGHRENILTGNYTETGVGVSFSEEEYFIYLYITQIFEGPYYYEQTVIGTD
jgi:uncharacterized protein YkwD